MTTETTCDRLESELAPQIEELLLARNQIYRNFFSRRQGTAAGVACREMAERFLRGGRLLAFGRGPYATDAQHVSVEFVHPVIVGSALCRRSIFRWPSRRGSMRILRPKTS